MQKLKYGNGSISLRRRKRKDGTERRYYQGRIYIDGEQKTVYGNTQAECLEKLKRLREERDKARAQRLLNIEGQPRERGEGKQRFRTFGEWLDEWAEECKKINHKETYTPEFNRNVATVRAALGGLVLHKIEALELQKYLNTFPRSNSTVKKYDIINGSLQKAEDFGIIKRNPCRAVNRPTYVKQKRRAFELAEQCAILSALPERYAAVFFFLCSAGLRIGEFLALTSDKVNFAGHYISVGATKDLKTGIIVVPKTEAGVRKVYFTDALFNHFDIQTLGTYSYNAIKKAFSKTYKKLGIEGVSVTHSCRHTFSSLLYAVGVPDKVIQSLCGHADLKTTMDTYTNLLMQGESPVLDYIRELKSTLESTLLLK